MRRFSFASFILRGKNSLQYKYSTNRSYFDVERFLTTELYESRLGKAFTQVKIPLWQINSRHHDYRHHFGIHC
jgi:hypothetical protein